MQSNLDSFFWIVEHSLTGLALVPTTLTYWVHGLHLSNFHKMLTVQYPGALKVTNHQTSWLLAQLYIVDLIELFYTKL